MVITHDRTKYILNGLSVKKIINGAEILVGSISNFNKLVSVAEENGMDQNHQDYEIFKSRFYFTHQFTIDIKNYKEIAKMKFWIIKPRQYGDGTYMSTLEILKMKK